MTESARMRAKRAPATPPPSWTRRDRRKLVRWRNVEISPTRLSSCALCSDLRDDVASDIKFFIGMREGREMQTWWTCLNCLSAGSPATRQRTYLAVQPPRPMFSPFYALKYASPAPSRAVKNATKRADGRRPRVGCASVCGESRKAFQRLSHASRPTSRHAHPRTAAPVQLSRSAHSLSPLSSLFLPLYISRHAAQTISR